MRLIFLMLLSLLLWSATTIGETYKYVDDKGTPNFTDDIKSIPKKYRKNAVLIKEDDGRVVVAPPPQADKIDESLLPQKEEEEFKADEITIVSKSEIQETFPYKNVLIISSLFLATLIPTFFLNNGLLKRLLGLVSTASILTLLIYISVFFASIHMLTLKNDAKEMTEKMRKKEEEKGKAIQDLLEGSDSKTNNLQ